jgi:hypothetical protein
MEKQRLHDLVVSYRHGSIGREAVFERIAGAVLQNPARFGFDGEDDAAEALSRYRERICCLVDRYVDRGVPFDAFLVTSMHFIARTVRRVRRLEREREVVCETSEGWKVEARYEDDMRSVMEAPARSVCRGTLAVASTCAARDSRRLSEPELAAFRNRIVFLYLKCAWEADDEKTERVAAAASVPVDWLAAASAQSLRSLEAERIRFERLAERRDRAWGRIRLLEGRLREEADRVARSRMADSLSRERARLERARSELHAFRPVVPNSVVARILGIPKGTVDSGLFYLKKQAARRNIL